MVFSTYLPDAPAFLFGAAAVCAYLGARVGSPSFRIRHSNIGMIAVAHWLPVAAVALVAARHHRALAVCVLFGSSVATLCLAMGVSLLCSARLPAGMWSENQNRRAWGMVLPLALLALLCGFSGRFTLLHAALLAVQGALAWMLWFPAVVPRDVSDNVLPIDTPRHRSPTNPLALFARTVLAIILSLLFAILTLRAAATMSGQVQHLGEGLMAVLMVTPALALPILGTGLNVARDQQRGDAMVSFAVAIVLLNLGLLLPVVVAIGHFTDHLAVHMHWHDWSSLYLERLTPSLNASSVPYPMATWRIDTVALLLIGALLIPVANGRWALRRFDGLLLLLGYCLYIVFNAIFVAVIAMR